MYASFLLLACLIDIAIGWPDRLYARIGHPVTWIGALIAVLERRLNAGGPFRRLVLGGLTVLVVVGMSAAFAFLIQRALPGLLPLALVAWPFIALRSMYSHVQAVALPLVAGDLTGARRKVALIVGRDPARLDDAGVARATLESLAENTSDGIVAPVFWGVVAGLPGLVAYKAINTLDSMIGHRNERYEHFGKVAARVDDLINLIPARLTCILFALVSGRARKVARLAWREAGHHRSPNAGWPESAMAASLDVRLSGPRAYGTEVSEEPWLNGKASDPDGFSVRAGLALYRRAMFLKLCVLAALMAF